MKISGKQLLKYFYFSLLIMWILLTLHILYLYTVHSSSKKPVKGGTLLEATFDKASYIPYITTSNSDNFYKSFLFNSCLQPYVDGTKIEYKDDLCIVSTKDNKTYTITINSGQSWSDEALITIDDVYFTYNTIIKENVWQLPVLEKFKNLSIEFTGDSILVTFPLPSIDNKIFFTNYILPKHIVDGLSLDDYLERYSSKPVKTGCANIKSESVTSDGFVFDMSDCDNTFVKYYQVKSFPNKAVFEDYVKTNKTIDIFIDSLALSGYNQNKVILNKFVGIFYNTTKSNVDQETRRAFSNYFNSSIMTGNYNEYIIEDKFLFDADIKSDMLHKRLDQVASGIKSTVLVDIEIPDFPSKVDLNVIDEKQVEYYLGEIKERFSFAGTLKGGFDSISISHNGRGEYKLQSYTSGSNSFFYNLSPVFNNIVKGKNTYEVKGYTDGKGETLINVIVYYMEKPKQEIKNENTILKYTVVYFEDEVSNFIVNNLKNSLEIDGLNKYFDFIGFLSADDFRTRLSNQDYDIVIRGVDMGLKRDISALFQINDNPEVNPSLYKNIDLASLINQYFITEDSLKKKIKGEIDVIYQKEIPFIILGKTYGILNVRDGLDFAYPERLYDYWFRKDYGGNIQLSYKPYIEKEKLLNYNNFITFIKNGLKFDLDITNNN
ncbi:MAG: hypothetical protein V3575_06910 [Candidatus Absconditabacteria bacterium]